MPDQASLGLTGGFRLASPDGGDVAITSKRARALLAILALSPGHSASRARLRALLWSNRGEQQAGDSLRQLLTTLRKELTEAGLDFLEARDDVLALDPLKVAIDVAAIDAGNAATFYRGPLLDGLDIGDNSFESWLAAEREKLATRMQSLFAELAQSQHGQQRIQTAAALVAIDPLREASHRVLISAYLAAGERAGALRQLQACRDLLQRELGVKPEDETEMLLRQQAAQEPAVPALPVITVRPFADLSDDQSQRYFSEGISGDIATELSRFRNVMVRSAKPGEGGGSGYIVTGSVRRMGKRLRIAAYLTDGATASQIWSERFDTGEDAVFELQDRIVATIAAQLSQRLSVDVVGKAQRKPPANLAAYEFLLRGDALPLGDPKIEEEARNLFRQAIDRDPGYARAYAFLGEYTMLEWIRDPAAPRTLLDKAIELTGKALELDSHDPACHGLHGHVLMWRKDLDLAEHHYLKSLSLNPNHPAITAGLGIVCGYLGDPERGIALFDRALELDPHFDASWYWRDKGTILFMARRYEEAIACLKRSPMPLDFVEAYLAACHAYLGHDDEARRHAAGALKLTPGFTIGTCRDIEPFRHAHDIDHLAEGMRRAGLPE